ncbi:DNA adenine methylase [Ferroplasma sp.]|jgi:DNA adenine methylase|uniref:DNA adenine methylase n=1 Tax=Ferroplasma sp. TaxID=2591003 RepID=UPI00263397B3|nr:DNA adenine methylase [Ferroplasma sp.]
MESLLNEYYKPILKWAGGKRQLLPVLLKNIPDKFNTYYEPFIGGAAMLISLYSLNKINNAVISDTNTDLYNLYRTIREEPQELIDELNNLKFRNSRDDYYRARSLFNSTEDSVTRSAILIYLNRHGYNGLYRVNSNNKFNVPFGKYSNPGMPSPENIMALSKILQSCSLMNSDFEAAVMNAVRGDFVYFDPPYMPLSKTSYFTGYTHSGFDERDQERLSRTFKELSRKGVYVMESNSSTELIRELYKDFSLIEVDARRNINSVGTKRDAVKELIITNYGVS